MMHLLDGPPGGGPYVPTWLGRLPVRRSVSRRRKGVPYVERLLREAVGIRAGVSAFEVHLVGPHAVELDEAGGIERHAAVLLHIDLRKPPLDAVGIELIVPRAIQRVGHVDAL